MRAALYARVSTADQTTDNQTDELRCYAEARGWTVTEYTDTISGAKDRRPSLRPPQSLEDASTHEEPALQRLRRSSSLYRPSLVACPSPGSSSFDHSQFCPAGSCKFGRMRPVGRIYGDGCS